MPIKISYLFLFLPYFFWDTGSTRHEVLPFWTNLDSDLHIFFYSLIGGHSTALFMYLQDFILRARVLKLYRQALRTARRGPSSARG
ncbi:uncharacterized protein LOC129318593 isoform X2 [Prosopis cineraria]|uniref:uncharacterized protein LOC129318593 isoform X2 n=1 Tax=Prosopis cineraria TaxID=364024 RepID=UPI00240FF697|nr:uncharacterized protein LOC129318593 isoform X2 [Prosopis cineraria]